MTTKTQYKEPSAETLIRYQEGYEKKPEEIRFVPMMHEDGEYSETKIDVNFFPRKLLENMDYTTHENNNGIHYSKYHEIILEAMKKQIEMRNTLENILKAYAGVGTNVAVVNENSRPVKKKSRIHVCAGEIPVKIIDPESNFQEFKTGQPSVFDFSFIVYKPLYSEVLKRVVTAVDWYIKGLTRLPNCVEAYQCNA